MLVISVLLIREPGRYVLRQYSQRRNPQTELYRLTLGLERIEQQKPMHDLCAIPLPSQVDRWRVFDILEGEMVKRELGEVAEMQWKLAKAKYSTEKKQFQIRLRADHEAKGAKAKPTEEDPADGMEKGRASAPTAKFSDLLWER